MKILNFVLLRFLSNSRAGQFNLAISQSTLFKNPQAIVRFATLSQSYGKEASPNSIESVLHLDTHLGGCSCYIVAAIAGAACVVVSGGFE